MRSFALALILFFSLSSVMAEPPLPGTWDLVFDENFNSFNSEIWNTELETGLNTHRRSKCFFLDKNVQVDNGNLLVTVKNEKLKLKNFYGKLEKRKYSCGSVNSFRKFRQMYGYFEARIKQPDASGLSTAFWLMPDRSFNWKTPFSPGIRSTKIIENSVLLINGKGMEIDIMEYLTKWKRGKTHWAAHWGGYGDGLKSKRGYFKPKKKFSDDFHNYGLYWDKNILIWFFDGKEIARMESKRVANLPHYIILSTNLGSWDNSCVENNKLPASMIVDYVKIWQKDGLGIKLFAE